MSDLPATPPEADAERLRQLGAAYLALQVARQSNRTLEAELQRMRSSQGWRLTAPLRRLRAWWDRRPAVLPSLRPADLAAGTAVLTDPSELLRHRLGVSGRREQAGAQALNSLYLDVTELEREDHGAGVQRVVRRILCQWLLEPPGNFRVEPVRLSADAGYVHARGFLARMLGMAPGEAGADSPLTANAGDRFLGLDLIRDRAAVARPALERLRAAGVRLSFIVYDLLPLQRPDWFPPGVAPRFREWLELVVELSDRLICISESVATQLRAQLAGEPQGPVPRISSFPLGSDLETFACANAGRESGQGHALRVLMVGTVEPRKGHEQALAAFEQLWRRGHALELVIAGHAGWAAPGLLDRLRKHPESDRRLHWLEGADDAAVLACYRQSDLLLAASQGEGYGLPLVEAASQGLPILARDLPVFREVAGQGADYFQGDDGDALAAAIEDWLVRKREGRLADPALVRRHDWRSAANLLQDELFRN
jgi:glycosyltransferase involved in cell wall biosynthesis